MRKHSASIALLGLLSACGGDSSSTPPPTEASPLPAGPVVAFMGDSITQYWSGGSPAYPTPITTLVPGAIDAGIAGEVTQDMQQRFAADVLARSPQVVVILGGTNDIRLQQNPTVDAIASMAQHASAAGIRVIIGTVPPSELWLGSTFLTESQSIAAVTTFNEQLQALASAYGYAVVDYYSALANAQGLPKDDGYFLTDHIHPSAEGYVIMWNVLRPVLVSVEAQ